MTKIDFIKLNSANVSAENVDTERVYNVNANVNISGQVANSFDGGSVTNQEGIQVATFSRWGENSLNMNFINLDATAMCAVITEVQAFIEAVEEKVATEPIEI